jgi:hypothetical protein
MKFQIYVDGQPSGEVFDTLREAFAAAIGYVLDREEVCIRSGQRTWSYDYDVDDWVGETCT